MSPSVRSPNVEGGEKMDDIIVGAGTQRRGGGTMDDIIIGVVTKCQGGNDGRHHVEGEMMGNVIFGNQQYR